MTGHPESPDSRLPHAADQRLPSRPRRAIAVLLVLAAVSCALYAVIAVLSRRFAHGTPTTDRPIVAVLLLFAVAFAAYLLAVRVASRASPTRTLVAVLAGSAIAFRLILLPSTPIQEIDIYRYLWDGAVLRAGVSPFRYSPQQVRTANRKSALPEDLARLVRLRDTQRPLKTVLARIHYGHVPTVYPPVSQLVFAAAAWTTPATASVPWRIVIMKAWMVGWDLATLWLVFRLLSLTGRPIGWAVLYGWCPLLMKEVANSGHLDVIAVFLTTLSLYLLVKSTGAGQGSATAALALHRSARVSDPAETASCSARVSDPAETTSCSARVSDPAEAADRRSPRGVPVQPPSRGSVTLALLSGVTLALAVGAKLYPVVLAPLAALVVARRFGWRWSTAMLLLFVAVATLVLWPMLPSRAATHPVDTVQQRPLEDGARSHDLAVPSSVPRTDGTAGARMTNEQDGWGNPCSGRAIRAMTVTDVTLGPGARSVNRVLNGAGQGRGAAPTTPTAPDAAVADADPPTEPPLAEAHDPSLGLKTFLRRWEMNEFLFLLLLENLKPAEAVPDQERAWFSVLPERFRQAPIAWLQARFSLDGWEAAFWLTRLITALAFVALALVFAGRAAASDDPLRWLESAFLTLAWFWLLAPTQNPWYWTWVVPLLPLTRSRVWWAMSGLVLVYYLRFWLRYHFPDPPVLGTRYRGEVFFDLVVTWLEYAPWFAALGLVWWRQRRQRRPAADH
jgi:hypothetical protein